MVSALTGEMQIEAYTRITNNKNKLVQCTPKEQAGQWWDEENQRDSRAGFCKTASELLGMMK